MEKELFEKSSEELKIELSEHLNNCESLEEQMTDERDEGGDFVWWYKEEWTRRQNKINHIRAELKRRGELYI